MGVASCRLYDGQVMPCTVYTQSATGIMAKGGEMGKESMPNERYVDIIVRGMREFGVKQEAINKLLAIPSRPRAKAHEFKTLDVPQGTPSWTMQQFRDEVSTGQPLTVVNGKVCEYIGPKEGTFWKLVQTHIGSDCTYLVAALIWEPMYE